MLSRNLLTSSDAGCHTKHMAQFKSTYTAVREGERLVLNVLRTKVPCVIVSWGCVLGPIDPVENEGVRFENMGVCVLGTGAPKAPIFAKNALII